MERFAFIDATNTKGTIKTLLDFEVDWKKLYEHLVGEKWFCSRVFYYEGFRKGKSGEKNRVRIEKIGYIMRGKLTHIHKDENIEVGIVCKKCGFLNKKTIIRPGNQKSNCDVELTVDALELAKAGNHFLVFTGDGDFRYLIEKLIEKGVVVFLVSNTRKDIRGNKRFSTRLKKLLEIEAKKDAPRVIFVDLNDWKEKIKKEPPSSVAVPNDGSSVG